MSLPYNQKYVTFDVETTGLNLYSSLPWQVSWQVHHGTKLIQSFDEYVDWPDLKLSDFIIKLTGFSWSKYNSKKRPPLEVLEKLEKFLYDPEYIVIGQNLIGYDIYLISTLQRLCGKTPDYSYLKRIYDTQPLGKAFREGLEKPKNQNFLSWQFKIKNDKSLKAKSSQLVQLKSLGIPFEESRLHDSLYDVEMTFKIFQELKKKMNL